jgi:hypothetical protein
MTAIWWSLPGWLINDTARVLSSSGAAGLAAGGGGAEPVGTGPGGDDVGVVGEPVDDRGAKAGVGERGGPFNWDWLRFLIGVLPFDLLVSASGVSA